MNATYLPTLEISSETSSAHRPANPWPALLVVCLGFFMIMLDTTIVLVATPSMLTSLGASFDAILWVINGYLLSYAVLLITAGRLGDIYGPRTLFALGLVVFTASSATCGLAQNTWQLVGGPDPRRPDYHVLGLALDFLHQRARRRHRPPWYVHAGPGHALRPRAPARP